MRLSTAVLLTLLPSALAAQTAAPDPVAAVAGTFDAMRAADTTALGGFFAPGLRLIITATDSTGVPIHRVVPRAAFLQSIGRTTATLDEQMYEPEVRIDGPLATVWNAYEFFADGTFSHCGVDSFHLLRDDAGWTIAQVADTQRRTPGDCRRGVGPVGDPLGTADDSAAVIGVVHALFAAMAASDSSGISELLLDAAAVIGVDLQSGERFSHSVDEFAELVARGDPRGPLHERMFAPEVRISDNLATIWAEYDFHFGETFSHCGTDAFQLVRTGDGWKLATVSFTMRTEGCPAR